MVSGNAGRKHASGGSEGAERLGPVRHARQRAGMVSGLVGGPVLRDVADGRSNRAVGRLAPGDPRRLLGARRVLLPGVGPLPGLPRLPHTGFRVARIVSRSGTRVREVPRKVAGTPIPVRTVRNRGDAETSAPAKPPPATKPAPPWDLPPARPTRHRPLRRGAGQGAPSRLGQTPGRAKSSWTIPSA